MGPGRVLSTGTRLRVAIAVTVLLVNAVHGTGLDVLPWTLLVLGADLGTGAILSSAPLRPRERRTLGLTLTAAGAALAGLALLTGAGGLMLATIPLIRAAETWGRRALVLCGGLYAATAFIAWAAAVTTHPDLHPDSLVLWAALTACLGALAAWTNHIVRRDPADAVATEATWLMQRLDGLATEMRAGFDPATSAEHLLDGLPAASQTRSAVLVGGPDDRPVPLALRGALRVPWEDPRLDTGILYRAWRQGQPSAGIVDGRATVAVPLWDTRDRQIGMVVVDHTADQLPDELLRHVLPVVASHQGLVGVAMSFGALRERAGIEERERLARQIHDGVAQELVALGFRVDRLKRLPADQLLPEVGELRTEVSRILADVRSHIGDLRLTVRPDTGLGAAITAQAQAFGAATGSGITLHLSESSFRLPAHVETGLYRTFLAFLADARRAQADVEVSLRSHAPEALMVLRHTGPTRLDESDLRPYLTESSGAVARVVDSPAGTEISVQFTAAPHSSAVLDERLPQPS